MKKNGTVFSLEFNFFFVILETINKSKRKLKNIIKYTNVQSLRKVRVSVTERQDMGIYFPC